MNVADKAEDAGWIGLARQYIVVACGLGLAVSAALAVGGWQTEARPASEAQKSVAAPNIASTLQLASAGPEPYVFYLVSSDLQRYDLIVRTLGAAFPSEHSRIVVMRSLEDEVSIGAILAELAEQDKTVEIIDLQNR